jgi:hypothetical protein
MKAQIIGMVIFLLLFVACIILLCNTLNFGTKWTSVTVATILLVVSSSEKLREIFWGHIIYYSFGPMLLLLIVSLVIRSLKCGNAYLKNPKEKETTKKAVTSFAILFVGIIVCAINGMQIMTLSSLPIMLAVIMVIFFELHTDLLSKENWTRYAVVIIMGIATIIGLLLAKLIVGDVTAGYAESYSCFSDSSQWVHNFASLFPNFFTLLGADTSHTISLYSFEGICNLLRIVFALIILITPVIMAILYGKFKKVEYKILIIVHHIVTLLILMGWTFGRINAANWRLTPIIVTSTLLSVLFVKWIYENVEFKRLQLIIEIPVICMLLIITSNIITMENQSTTNAQLNTLAEYLENNNLEYGYATFWQANIVTLLSDSEVKVRNISVDEEGYSIYAYQTNLNWYGNATGYNRYFVVLTATEYANYYENSTTIERATEVQTCGTYKVLIYDHNIF